MMKKYIVLGTALLAVLAAPSCKKSEDETTNTPSLSGLSINEAPVFLEKGTVLTFKADISSLTVSKGDMPEQLGLYWQVNSAKKDTLTRDAFADNHEVFYTVDTLGTYNVFFYAFANGFYNASASTSFTAIDPETVLTGTAQEEEITVNGITWKTSNLCNPNTELGKSFRNSAVLDHPLGRLYNWTEAQTACPAGWHLPSAQDFVTSFSGPDASISSGDLMADAYFLEEKMWEYWTQVTITNKHGFNALPVGYIDEMDPVHTYNKWGEYALWWTSDSVNNQGVYIYLYEELPQSQMGNGDKQTLYLSVRCVKD